MTVEKNRAEQLLRLLNAGAELTYEQAASLLHVSERTVQRCLDRIRKEGTVIDHRSKRPVVFFIPEEHRQHGVVINLSEEEILALTVAADASHGTLQRTPLGPALQRAINKLLEEMPNELIPIEAEEADMYWHFSGNPASEIDPEVFRELVTDIRDCNCILVDYQSASGRRPRTDRPLDPYALAVQGGSWLLVAWCHWNNSFRDFSISAISNVRRTGKNFLRRESFDLNQHFQGRFRAVGGNATHTVRIRVEPDRITYFNRKRYHPSQKVNVMPDGTAIVEYTVSGLEDIRSFAQSWGNGITVLEPPELVAVIRAQANELANRYNRQEAESEGPKVVEL